jgi:hypothetical protein
VENALVIVDQAGPLVELAATLELAADFARASKAKTTLAAYGSDWRRTSAPCKNTMLLAQRGVAIIRCRGPGGGAIGARLQACW